MCKMMTSEFPAPAVGVRATSQLNNTDSSCRGSEANSSGIKCPEVKRLPGTLPESASELSMAARGLLLRLLDRDPRVRMRNFRQLQQCAFYMGFNFEHVKAKKVAPKTILEKHFPNGVSGASMVPSASQVFTSFDQPTFV